MSVAETVTRDTADHRLKRVADHFGSGLEARLGGSHLDRQEVAPFAVVNLDDPQGASLASMLRGTAKVPLLSIAMVKPCAPVA
mgnify:CR=1 FL=1